MKANFINYRLLTSVAIALVSAAAIIGTLYYSGWLLVEHWQTTLAPCAECIKSFSKHFFVRSHLLPMLLFVGAAVGLIRSVLFIKREIEFHVRYRKHNSMSPVTLVDSGTLAAWSGGLLQPTIYAHKDFWHSLSPTERLALQTHEQVHVDQQETLQFFCLGLTRALLPIPYVSQALHNYVQHTQLRSEFEADQAAINCTSRETLASLLYKALQFESEPTLVSVPAIDSFIDKRIDYITSEKHSALPMPNHQSLLLCAFTIGITLSGFYYGVEPIAGCLS
jgi:hypothetical protein